MGLTDYQVKRQLRMLDRWKAYMRFYAEHGGHPNIRACRRLWGLRSTYPAFYQLQRLVTYGLLHRYPTGTHKSLYYPNAEIVETGGKRYALTRY